MDTADRAPDKSVPAPTTAWPPPDRNTPRETEPASFEDRLPPSALPDRYTAPRNSPHTARKILPPASAPPRRCPPCPTLRPMSHRPTSHRPISHQKSDRIPPRPRWSSLLSRVRPRSPH